MDIKKRAFGMVIIVILFTLTLGTSLKNREGMNSDISIKAIEPAIEVKSNDVTFIDKVYNITTDEPWKMLDDIPFRATFNYYIYFQVVTPHECEITITIFDPEGSQYDVYHKDTLTQNDGLENFPFGAAFTGPYDILFELGIAYNLNIYIKIEETIQCLYDVFDWQEVLNIRQYGVTKFEDSSSLIRNLPLDSDIAYIIYLARVTPLSDILPDYTVRFDYSLLDVTQDILFIINWKDTPLAPINEVTTYSFGTAYGGPYQTNLTIEYDYNPVNIAYAIVEDHKISEEIDENSTSPGMNQESTLLFSIPIELATGSMIGIGILLIIVLGITITKRRGFNSP